MISRVRFGARVMVSALAFRLMFGDHRFIFDLHVNFEQTQIVILN